MLLRNISRETHSFKHKILQFSINLLGFTYKMPENIKIGTLGENIAEKYLKNKGFLVISRNYREKWGEIDIVCKKGQTFHFVEVKSVSQGTYSDLPDKHRPEDMLHQNKAKRLRRVIETYIDRNLIKEDFVCDLITVRIDQEKMTARVAMFENIIF